MFSWFLKKYITKRPFSQNCSWNWFHVNDHYWLLCFHNTRNNILNKNSAIYEKKKLHLCVYLTISNLVEKRLCVIVFWLFLHLIFAHDDKTLKNDLSCKNVSVLEKISTIYNKIDAFPAKNMIKERQNNDAEGSSTNHVDSFLGFFNPPPSPLGDKRGHFWNPPPCPCGFFNDPPPPACFPKKFSKYQFIGNLKSKHTTSYLWNI